MTVYDGNRSYPSPFYYRNPLRSVRRVNKYSDRRLLETHAQLTRSPIGLKQAGPNSLRFVLTSFLIFIRPRQVLITGLCAARNAVANVSNVLLFSRPSAIENFINQPHFVPNIFSDTNDLRFGNEGVQKNSYHRFPVTTAFENPLKKWRTIAMNSSLPTLIV